MSCIYKIRESLSTCTSMEKRLADYIIDNKDKVINYSTQLLAEESNTSAATVVRYAKKLGYKGFQHLKIDLAKDNSDEDFSFDNIILEDDDVDTLIKKSYVSNFKTLEQTYKLLNTSKIEEAITALCRCNTIYLVGVGGSAIICEDLVHKLTRINKKVVFYQNFHILLHTLTYIEPNDVLIAVSYSGETNEVLDSVKIANKCGATTIAITQFTKNNLSKLANISLYVPTKEKEMRLGAISSRFSSFIISDLLYLGIAKEHVEDTKNKILNTRKTIKINQQFKASK